MLATYYIVTLFPAAKQSVHLHIGALFYIILFVNKVHEKTKTNNALIRHLNTFQPPQPLCGTRAHLLLLQI